METAYVKVARQRIDSIPEPTADEVLLITPSKRGQPRIAFGRLVEAGYLQPGQTLYSKDRQYCAVIHADSYLIAGDFSGSIHQVAAHVQSISNFNGWEFWFYEDQDSNLISIDILRESYHKENL